jgi:phenylpyruvate tautomerase PptA (4-oxalocrotonate tautomerase family)
MPFLKLETSVTLDEKKQQELMAALSKCVASTIGKPEQYVMIAISHPAMMMAGQTAPAAFVDLRSIGGLSGTVNRNLSRDICALLDSKLGVPPNRIFISFTEFSGENWGWNGQTFG